jgi:zinc D-Ala-D-Ala dipeptidase
MMNQLSTTIFGPLAVLRTRPLPDMAPLRTRKGVQVGAAQPNSAAAAEPLVDLNAMGLLGRNHYAHAENPPYWEAIPGAVDKLLARAGVAARLARVEARLAAGGRRLFLFDAWRPRAVQAYFHDVWMPAALARTRPDLSGEAL